MSEVSESPKPPRLSSRRSQSPETERIDFQAAVNNILNTPLSPDNIEIYAEGTLTSLIKLTSSISAEYKKQHSSGPHTGRDLEDVAFAYFGLSSLGQTLDHITSKAKEIAHLDEIIDKVEIVDSVIVPPQDDMIIPRSENGTLKPKSIILRTKTLLFILSNDFEVDLDDKGQLSLKTGVLSDNMMRNLSYYLISVPKLDRTILCCDEEGNVTYIFDNKVLEKHGIAPADLTELTKSDINDLLESDSQLGKRVIYSTKFVPKMRDLIHNPQASDNPKTEEHTNSYLYPKAPEGVLSTNGIAKSLRLGSATVQKAIDELGENLGTLGKYRFFAKIASGYTPEQQAIIRQYLSKRELFIDKAPKEVLSTNGIAKSLRLGSATVQKAIDELGESLGTLGRYKFWDTVTYGYTPEQQEMIHQHLSNKGLLADKAPEGVLPVKGIAKSLGKNYEIIDKAIDELGENLGKVGRYKFQSVTTYGYTPEQQALIIEYIKNRF